MTTQENYLHFDINTCMIDYSQFQNGSFQITEGDKISFCIHVGNHPLDHQLGLAFIYSKLMQTIYPDHTLEPFDAAFTLPNTNYTGRFENFYQLKQFIKMNDMMFCRDEKQTDYFCHTNLPRCSWVGEHYQNNPVGFSVVEFRGIMTENEYYSLPEVQRIDVIELMDNGAIPLINTMILDQCFQQNTLPSSLNFKWNESLKYS